jgi:putative DNA primase/helicase
VLLAAWMPPAGIEEVLICADNDASYTGQSAAFSLARRLVRDGLKAEVVIPENINTDWADI